ncbi:MAG: DUF4116 domain-containing protein, partial [Treponema sp.]|nr:DUF4116 domain-containing protein [Treponema sp.]
MSANVIINVMGTKEDVHKLFDALCKPNKYNGTGIRLDSDSIRKIEGTEFPLWEAKGETDNMPEHNHLNLGQFNDLFTDFPALGIRLIFNSADGDEATYGGVNGHCNMRGRNNQDEIDESIKEYLYNQWKTLEYVPETIIKTEAMCFEAVKLNGCALEYVPEELKTVEMCLTAVKQCGWALYAVPEELKTAELCLEAVKQYGKA